MNELKETRNKSGLLRELQRKEAVKRMWKLRLLKQPIKEFEEEGKLNRSESVGMLYWLSDDEQKMVDDFEKRCNGVVYHVIKTNTNFGAMYSLLYVSDSEEEWDMDMEDIANGQALAYVVNVDYPDCSEFGTIGVKPSFGGLMRTW